MMEDFLTVMIGNMLRKHACTVAVLETQNKWFGVTCKEDKDLVIKSFRNLIENGAYGENLYADLKAE